MSSVIQIGNSKGIRIPKAILAQTHLEGVELEFEVVKEGLLIKPVHQKPRHNWAELLQAASKNNEPTIEDISNQFDDEDWQWPNV